MGGFNQLGGLIGGITGGLISQTYSSAQMYTTAQTYYGWQQTVTTAATTSYVYYPLGWGGQAQAVQTFPGQLVTYDEVLAYHQCQPPIEPLPETPPQVVTELPGGTALREQEDRAIARAREILERFLSPAQLQQWKLSQYFDVRGHHSEQWYRLFLSGAPRRLNAKKDGFLYSYCIHTHGVPRCDELLGFKLLLEINEPHFLETANATRLN